MRALASVLAVALFFALPANADQLEQYTGKWVLDIKASDMETPPVFSEVTLDYKGNDSKDIELKARWVQKDGKVNTRNYTYVCDGNSQDIQEEEDLVRAANAVWEEDRLKIVSTMSRMGMEFTVDTEWKLKGENTLEIQNHMKGAVMDAEWTEVYRRKGAK